MAENAEVRANTAMLMDLLERRRLLVHRLICSSKKVFSELGRREKRHHEFRAGAQGW